MTAAAPSEPRDLAELLHRWRLGDPEAQGLVVEQVYGELRALARAYMSRERPEHTLQATALVHEALLRLLSSKVDYRDRQHFFRAAAQAMRRILVDHARRLAAGHRIPRHHRLPLDAVTAPIECPQADLLELDQALSDLAALDPTLARIVELRCFVGLTIPEVAELQGVSESTVSREWRHAKAWLRQALTG